MNHSKVHTDVATGYGHTCIALSFDDGNLGSTTKCWGWNEYGQSEVPYSMYTGVIQINSKYAHTCAISHSLHHQKSSLDTDSNSVSRGASGIEIYDDLEIIREFTDYGIDDLIMKKKVGSRIIQNIQKYFNKFRLIKNNKKKSGEEIEKIINENKVERI